MAWPTFCVAIVHIYRFVSYTVAWGFVLIHILGSTGIVPTSLSPMFELGCRLVSTEDYSVMVMLLLVVRWVSICWMHSRQTLIEAAWSLIDKEHNARILILGSSMKACTLCCWSMSTSDLYTHKNPSQTLVCSHDLKFLNGHAIYQKWEFFCTPLV